METGSNCNIDMDIVRFFLSMNGTVTSRIRLIGLNWQELNHVNVPKSIRLISPSGRNRSGPIKWSLL